ncbi:MAG: M24 family metallopeptidase [Deltaproteobacteria bacterium]|nr:M24 family metallopeptidase [Deltaproteobacteria bacterium]MBW1818187.1 M24 family metallopeptidase [Deltaproteobacteria bacterium]MBW2284749.1 M24 family metallopeptidase [Deltaproteobacteria bacterium]
MGFVSVVMSAWFRLSVGRSLMGLEPSGSMFYGRSLLERLGHIMVFIHTSQGVCRKEMEPGMVLAIEPKYLFPGQGFVGVESTWVVTDGAWRN